MYFVHNHNSIFFSKDLLSYLSAESKQLRLYSICQLTCAIFSFTTNECCSRCCSLMLMFHFVTNIEMHAVCILTAFRIYNVFLCGHKCIPLHVSNLAISKFFCAIPLSIPCEKPYKDAFDRRTTGSREEKECEDVIVRSFPNFPFFLLT